MPSSIFVHRSSIAPNSSGSGILPFPQPALGTNWTLLGSDTFGGNAGQTASQFLTTTLALPQLAWSVGDLNNGALTTGGPGNTNSSVQQGGHQFCGNASVLNRGSGHGLLLRQQPAGGGTWQPTAGPGVAVSSVSDAVYSGLTTETGGITSANIWTFNPRSIASIYGTSLQPTGSIPEMVLEVYWGASLRQDGTSVYPFVGSYNEGNFSNTSSGGSIGFPEGWLNEIDWAEADGALPTQTLNIHSPGTFGTFNGSANLSGSTPTNLNVLTYHIRTASISDSAMTVYCNGTVVSNANNAPAADWWDVFSKPAFILIVNGGGPITAATNADVNDCQLRYVRVWSAI